MTTRFASALWVTLAAWGAIAASEPAEPPDHSTELAASFAVEAVQRIPATSLASEPLEQSIEYVWFGDFDGDGKPDLLVGDSTSSKPSRSRLRIYRNIGSASAPAFEAPVWFHDLCPTGLLPSG